MRETEFQPDAPGEIVPTEFREEREGASRIIRGPAVVPAPLPPKLNRDQMVGRLYDVLDAAKSNLLRLEGIVSSLPDANVLLRAMRLREVQASSRIENTVASLAEMALAEAGQATRTEALEVVRNRRVIEMALSSRLPVSRRLLTDMHRVLVGADHRSGRPGQLRDRQVYIGDEDRGFRKARFVPPPPGEHLDRCLAEWEFFVNPQAIEAPKRDSWPELIELAFAHYQFEAIHPFSDGNGRLGRALVNVAPVKSGLLKYPVCNLSEWIVDRRQEYYDHLLRVSTHNAWEPWTRFFCRALAEQASLDHARAERVLALRRKYHEAMMQRRNSALLLKLIDHLFERQVISIPDAATYLEVSYTAAQKHVSLLERSHILQQASRGTYAKVYLAQGILRAIRGQGQD